MNVNLTYSSGQSYSQYFSNFGITVSGGGRKRIKVKFAEKDGQAFASYSLPEARAQQFAYAILTALAGVEQPIEFTCEEAKPKAVAAD